MKSFDEHEREIVRRNWLNAAVLVLAGVVLGLSTYFETWVIPTVIVVSLIALWCGFICMMQTINQSWWGYNPVESLWIPVSIFGAVICFCALICSEFFAENAMKSLFYGGIPLMLPILGWQLGVIVNAIREFVVYMRYM